MSLQLWLDIAPYAFAVIFPLMAALAGVLFKQATANLPADKRSLLDEVARTVVLNVEQTASQQLNSAGKKQQALLDGAAMLSHLGVKHVSSDVLSQFIEAVVYSLNQSKTAANVTTTNLPMSTPAQVNG